MMKSLIPALLSLGVIASALLIGFGVYALAKGVGDRKRSVLMIVAGLVTMGNIWLWVTMPIQS
jgi:hypothetical protein